jgi:predicted Fe-S protein YdhL (DUF1289 family)
MRVRWMQLVAVLALVAFVCDATLAQRGSGQGKGKRTDATGRASEQRGDQMPPGKGPGQMMGPGKMMGQPGGVPPAMMERLREMTPREQERFLRNNQRFRMLPPMQQRMLRERLMQWNRLSPAEREAIRERERVWAQMSPEQQRRVREEIMPRWQQLPPERRQAVMRRLGVLRDLDDTQRDARLQDEEFLRGLSPEDRELLRELARLRIGPPADIRLRPPAEDRPPL